MSFTVHRRVALPLAAAATLAVTTIGVTSASADPDPVTSGSATLNLSIKAASTLAAAHIILIPAKPGTASFDKANGAIEYDLPVAGGDASTNTLYGSLKLGADLIVADVKTQRQLTLTNLTFDIEQDTISGTIGAGGAPIVLFDALGNHDYTTTQPETFSASSVQIDAVGAKALNKAIRETNAFKKGAVIGSFTTSFTNSNDG